MASKARVSRAWVCASRTTHSEWRTPSSAVASASGAAGRAPGQDVVHFARLRIGDHDRPGLGVQRVDLAHAVRFLVGLGVLVLADAVGVVLGDRGGGDQAGLRVSP